MAESARQIAQLVPATRKAGAVGIAPGTAHAMAIDAELFARAAVASRARGRVEPGLNAVLPPASRGREKSRRMRASRGRSRRDPRARVAVDARLVGMASRAEARLPARFFRMVRNEPGAV